MLKSNLSREMAVVLLIKIVLLYGLWNLCFKNTKKHVTEETFAAKVYS